MAEKKSAEEPSELHVFISADKETSDVVKDDSLGGAPTPRPPHHLAKTASMFMAYIGMGMSIGAWGPTLINLQILLSTDLKVLAGSMVVRRGGYLLGSSAGGVLIDLVNQEFLIAVSCLCLGLGFALLPWSPSILVFCGLLLVQGTGAGVIESGGQAYLLGQWKGSKLIGPMFQTLHFAWSVGATIGPFLVKPFLVPLKDQSPECATPLTNVTTNEPIEACNVTSTTAPPDVARVRYAFLIIGAVNVIVAVAYFFMFFLQGPFCCLRTKRETSERRQILPVKAANCTK